MGNAIGTPRQKPLTIHDLAVKIGEYRTINEGDPEMREDPEFPAHMMKEALTKNNTIDGNIVQGTYVYYPNKRKPKMWIGNYKILNPEDILCSKIAESIGMTESEWKNYIERKRRAEEKQDGRKSEEYAHIDNYGFENGPLQAAIDNNSINYTYDKNDYMNNFHNEYTPKNIHQHDESVELADGNYLSNQEYDMSQYPNESVYYANEASAINDMYDNSAYIMRLNEESDRIRRTQEEEIEQERNNIFSYSDCKLECDLAQQSEIHESYSSEMMKSPESIKTVKSTSPKAKQTYIKAHEVQSIQSLNGKKKRMPNKGHPTLASMSTKTSLVLNEKSARKI